MDLFKDLDEIFNEVKDGEISGFVELPDGEYLVKLLGAELTTSKSDKPMVVTALEVIHGEHSGISHRVYNVLTGADIDKTKRAVNRFAMFAKSFGAYTTGGIKGTVQSLDTLKDNTYKMVISTNDCWKNTNISQ